MTIDLVEYRDCLERAAPNIQHTLESTFHEAARIMSPQTPRGCIEGRSGLCTLG